MTSKDTALLDRPLADFLRLPASSLEHVASHPRVVETVNEKVIDDISLLLLHFTGLCIIVLIACYARLVYLMRIDTAPPQLAALITFTVLSATPLLALEISQGRAMYELGLFRTWASDGWNQIDLMSVLWVPAALIVGFVHGAEDTTFAIVASVGGLLLVGKLLGFLKALSSKLATDVLALTMILSDMQSFLVVLATVMLGFGISFFMLISNDILSLHDDDPDNVRAVPSDFVRAPQGISLSPALR